MNTFDMNCPKISDDLVWEPLPPRKKALYSDTTTDDNCNDGDVNKRIKTPSRIRKPVAEYQQILANIEARRNISHEHSTLESKDGCSSTFYECIIIMYNINECVILLIKYYNTNYYKNIL